jgi:hypothetical protein
MFLTPTKVDIHNQATIIKEDTDNPATITNKVVVNATLLNQVI